MARHLLVGVACLYASIAAAVTADELRDAAAQQDRETTQRQSHTDTGSIGALLPGDPQTSSKYDTNEKSAAKKRAAKKHDADAASGVGEVYTPPPRSSAVSGGQAIVTDAEHSTVAFGIRLGSWLNASLDRNTTSGESGSVELNLTGDAVGDRRTLPAGTVLFADKNLNNTTKRMEMAVTHGITPTGQEFEMHGLVFDPQKTPGLAGVYVLDKKESVSRGAQKGVIAAVGAAVGATSPGVAGVATNAATQSVLNDAGTVTDNNAAQAVIYVSPQALIIRVEKQF